MKLLTLKNLLRSKSQVLCVAYLAFMGSTSAFQIAQQGAAMSLSSDGTNYLAAIESHLTASPTISAQLLAADGTKIGGEILTNRMGIAADVSFNGEAYLLTWEDNGMGTLDGTTGYQMYGQFISRIGAAVDAPFPISGVGVWGDGLKMSAYGGGAHLVVYTKLINPSLGDNSTNRYIAGRLVQPDGSIGAELTISTGYGAGASITFDGTNFLVVWHEDQFDTEIRARLLSPAGVLGTEFSVNTSSAPSDNPVSASFDGTNFLITWSDEVGGAGSFTWDVFAQRVSRTGALVGSPITITNTADAEIGTTIAFDGVNYLVCWIDFMSETESNVKATFLSPAGTLIGSAFALDTRAGNEIGGALYGNGKYLSVIIDGELGDHGFLSVDATDGAFLSAVGTRPLESWRLAAFGGNAGNPSIAGDLADPDSDGVNNLQEYAFLGVPTVTNALILPHFYLANSKPHIQFTRPYPADVTYIVQASEDLITWEDVAILQENSFTWCGNAGITETGSGNSRTVTVFDSSTTPPIPRVFVRVLTVDNP